MTLPETEDVQDLQQAVTQALVELSQTTAGPNGVPIRAVPLEPAEVDWTSNGWMGTLEQLQGWLRLPTILSASSPGMFLRSLAQALDPTGALNPDTLDGVQHRYDLLSRLQERCSRAVELQKRLLEDRESDETASMADRRWQEAWDEVEEDPDSADAEPVSATTDVWPIADFASRAARGKLDLSPSYQRGDVWPTLDAQVLMESILRGIPLPSVIILKPQNSASGVYEVVDGKQRLTAILRFTGRHPRALEIVDATEQENPGSRLRELFHTDYRRFRQVWKSVTGVRLTDRVERDYYFPFKLRSGPGTPFHGPLETFRGAYYDEIKDRELRVADSVVAVSEVFETTCSYKIPVIQYTTATPRQVHEVFKLYNKQGKQLNAEEIRNAMFHELALVRGLLAAAGDSASPHEVAAFLFDGSRSTWGEDLSRTLTEYGFGTLRYKRTKVLSWFVSLLLLDPRQEGKVLRRSTAGQIDTLLKEVQENQGHALRDDERLRELFWFVGTAVETHQSIPEAWHRTLRNGAGAKWQEMPLVGSLLGVAQAVVVLGETETIDRLDDRSAHMEVVTRRLANARPQSIQTASQWAYISQIAVAVAEALGVDPLTADRTLRERFGSSGVAALVDVAGTAERR